ncbi:hypothetical protein Vafri_2438 [Volvox africanus]|nr:hypothetical protein Vafri_2438 [Volvox africanus]
MLYGPTFKEMHERGLLSVEAAATIEAGLTALTGVGGRGVGGRAHAWPAADVASKAAALRLRVNLWRSEVLAGVLEVDGQGEVVNVAHAKLHQAGLLFGLNTNQLARMRLSRLLRMPPADAHASATVALFQAPALGSTSTGTTGGANLQAGKSVASGTVGSSAAVRTALKSNRKPQKVGPLQLLTGHHTDGAPLELAVQAVVKEGFAMAGRTLVFVKFRNPYKAPDQAALLRALEAVAPKRLLRARGRRSAAAAAAAAAAASATATAAATVAVLPPPLSLMPVGLLPQEAMVSPSATACSPSTTTMATGTGDGSGTTGGMAVWSEDLVSGLEAGAAVGAGMGGGRISGLIPELSTELPSIGAKTAAAAPLPLSQLQSLRGPAVLPCDREDADCGRGSSGGGSGGGAVAGSPHAKVGEADIQKEATISKLAGSKDSDDVMLAGAARYDGGSTAAVAVVSSTDDATPFGTAAAVAASANAGVPTASAVPSPGAATAIGEDDDYDDFDDGDGDGSLGGKAGERESGDGEYRSVSSDSSSSSSSQSGGLRRGNSGGMRVSLDVGITAGTNVTGGTGGGGGRRRKVRRGLDTSVAANGTRRVILNTPSMKKRDGGGGGGVDGGGGGKDSGGGRLSPQTSRSSRRNSSIPAARAVRSSSSMLDSQPSYPSGGAAATAAAAAKGSGLAAVTVKGAGSNGGGGTASSSRGFSLRHVDPPLLSHSLSIKYGNAGGGGDDDGGGGGDAQGLFGELQSVLLAADAQANGASTTAATAVDGGGGGGGGGDHGHSSATLAASGQSGSMGPGPIDDPDEVGSQGSGVSGMEDEVGGAAHQADYRRGKRFKKLAAMLGSPLVQRAAQDFRWQALLANVAQVVSNLISFVLLTLLLHTQIKSVGRLTYTADGLLQAHELFIEMVVLDNVYRGLFPNTSWYSASSAEGLSKGLQQTLVGFKDHHSSSYLDSGTGRITELVSYNPLDLVHTWNYPAWSIMNFYSVDAPRVDLVNKSLWELGTSVWVQALDVQHMQTSLAAGRLRNSTAFLDAPLRNQSAPSNHDPFTDLIVARHLAGAYYNDTTQNSSNGSVLQPGDWIQVAGLGGNGSGAQNWSVPVLRAGLSWSDAWRFVLTAGPTMLHEGYHHTLLALVDRAVTASNNINRVQLVLMLVEGCAVATLLVTYMWWLQHRVTQQRYRVYGVFMAVPVGMIRALASRTITISQGSDSEEDSDDDEYQQQQQLSAATQVIARQFSTANSNSSLQSAVGILGFMSNMRLFSRQHTGATSLGVGGRASRARRHHRRRMIRNSRDSLKLLIPFVAWGVTICIIYATGYYYLQQVQAPVNLLSVIDSSMVSVHRLMLYSLLTCSELAAPARQTLRGLLSRELHTFKLQWDVMLYGANSTTAPQDRRFGRIQDGVSFIAADLARVLFRESASFNSDSPFHAATEHGLSYMVDRLVEDVEGLLAEPLEQANINSTRLAYIMTVGQGPLQSVFNIVHAETVTIVDNYYKVVDKLHIAAMILSWVLVICFVFFMLRPFLHRNRGETNRIAKMLSQLPADVDIEGLVYRLLLGAPAMRKRNRRASVSSLVAEDPVLAAKVAQAEAQAEKMVEAGFPPSLHRSGLLGQRSRSSILCDAGYGGDGGDSGGLAADSGIGSGLYGPVEHSRRGSAMGLYMPPHTPPGKFAGGGGGGGGGRGYGGGGGDVRSMSGLSGVVQRTVSGMSGDSGGGGSYFGSPVGRTLGDMGKSLKDGIPLQDSLGAGSGDSGGAGSGYDFARRGQGRYGDRPKGRIKGAWV